MKKSIASGVVALFVLAAGGATQALLASCGVFTDVSPAQCPFVLEMYYLGITAGTSATTFSPDVNVTRGQAAVFVSKGIDAAIQRSSRRAALGQWWTTTPQFTAGLGVTTLGPGNVNSEVACDGADVWVAKQVGVDRVRASDGRLLGSWTIPPVPIGVTSVFSAMGRIFATTYTETAPLFMIDPSQPAGPAVAVVPDLGQYPGLQMAFDGSRLWIPRQGTGTATGLTIVTPGSSIPWSTVHVDYTSFPGSPEYLTFDGKTMWLTDDSRGVLRLDSAGNVVQAIPVAGDPGRPAFDGANLWVPVFNPFGSDAIVVIRASDATVLATITGNGLAAPSSAAFDGERILVTNPNAGISIFRAASLAPLGTFATGFQNFNSCSDGLNFWIPLQPNSLGRY